MKIRKLLSLSLVVTLVVLMLGSIPAMAEEPITITIMACHGLPHRANIARYGGDEFVVLARVDGPEVIDRLTNCIHECLEKLNQGSPYALTVSIGIAKAVKGLKLESLIKEADTGLYREKKRR